MNKMGLKAKIFLIYLFLSFITIISLRLYMKPDWIFYLVYIAIEFFYLIVIGLFFLIAKKCHKN